MKKTVLILGSSLLALCAMAADSSEATTVNVSGITKAIPAKAAEVYTLTESVRGGVLNANTYKFDANDITLVNTAAPRHLPTTIIDTNDKTGLKLVAETTLNPDYQAANNYFGFNGTTIQGGGEITVAVSAKAGSAPVWVETLILQGIATHTANGTTDNFSYNNTTVNFNLGDKIAVVGSPKITLTDGVNLNWNTSNPLLRLNGFVKDAEGKNTTERAFVANNQVITFTGSNSTYVLAKDNTNTTTKAIPAINTVKLSKDAMTSVDIDGVATNVFRNFSVKGDYTKLTFDANAGNNLIMYNSSSSGLTFTGSSTGIELASGQVLTFKSASDSISALSTISVGGTGGKYVFDFSGTMSGVSLLNGNGTIEVAAGRAITISTRTSASSNYGYVLKSGVSIKTNNTRGSTVTSADGNNTIGSLNMEDNTTSFTTAGGLRFVGGNINGTLTVDGTGRIKVSSSATTNNVDDFMFAIYGGKTVFGSTAIVKQTYSASDASVNWVGKKAVVQSQSAEKSISFAKKLVINGGTTFILDSTDAYVIGKNEAWGATSQATSIFNLENYGSGDMINSDTTRFEINAQNNIGAFSFGSGRTLTLAFGANGSLVLGEAEGSNFTSLLGAVANSIILEGLVDEKLKIYDISKENLESYFTVANSEQYKLSIEAIDVDKNIYWVNTVAVPEPAHWVAIFGAIALAFVAYRKRK